MTGLRERKKVDTRRALSDATLHLAFERGLDNVTREAIADAAGVSLRTFNNYFGNKYEALAYRQVQRMERALAVFRERPVDEPLWSAIAESVIEPLTAEGVSEVAPTRKQLAVVREVVHTPELRVAMFRSLFTGWVEAIAERTGTDPERDMYPRMAAGVMGAVGEAAMDAYVMADPPVAITTLFRQGFAAVAAGLPAPTTHTGGKNHG
jgi:AcrR family transcriptional regulator